MIIPRSGNNRVQPHKCLSVGLAVQTYLGPRVEIGKQRRTLALPLRR